MIVTRTATPDDAQALAKLAESTFRDTFETENSADNMDLHCRKNFGEDIQAQEIRSSNYTTILALVDDEAVGFAQIRWRSTTNCVSAERPAELYRIYVSRDWQGQGVAQQLMVDVIAEATDAAADTVWLGVWERNPKAIAFYRKIGFNDVGEHVFNVGNDPQRDVLMAASIDVLSAQ